MKSRQMAVLGPFLAWLGGCYSPPPDLPFVDEVPIVPITNACAPQRLETVRCAIDGDTFSTGDCLGDGEVFRMLGIDTPEIAHDPEPADCFGNEAWLELAAIIENERVTLTFDETCTDIYDRTLAYVWLYGDRAEDLIEDDLNDQFEYPEDEAEEPVVLVNEWMLAKGFARVYDSSDAPLSDLLLGGRLQSAENRARNSGLGLWSQCSN